MKLSKRLAAVAKFVPAGAVVADIGTDHAFLPAFLAGQRANPKIIATEASAGPFDRALATVTQLAVGDAVELRLGDGLAVLRPGEAAVLVIAGMGGTSITQILAAGPAVVSQAKRLILQPMGGGEAVRRWLQAQGFAITAEDLVQEDGHFYEIIVAEPGKAAIDKDILFTVGPKLFADQHPLLREYLAETAAHYAKVLAQMTETDNAAAGQRRQELAAKLAELRGISECL